MPFRGCAAKPVVSLGEAAAIVRENALGLASNDPAEIRDFLQKCLEKKAPLVPDITGAADERFTRPYQFKQIDELMQNIVTKSAAARM